MVSQWVGGATSARRHSRRPPGFRVGGFFHSVDVTPSNKGQRLSRAGWAATTPSRLAERDQRNPANAAGRQPLSRDIVHVLPTVPVTPTRLLDEMFPTGCLHDSNRSPTTSRKEVTMFFGTGVCKGG